jgi:hypothetical protein
MTLTKVPFHKLHIGKTDATVEAGRQGFDDGYFGNEKANLREEKLQMAYNHEYNLAQSQRDRVEKKRAK